MCIVCEISVRHPDAPLPPAACRCGAPETMRAFARLERDFRRREMLGGTAAVLAVFAGLGLGAGRCGRRRRAAAMRRRTARGRSC
jgi:hypothetical protein